MHVGAPVVSQGELQAQTDATHGTDQAHLWFTSTFNFLNISNILHISVCLYLYTSNYGFNCSSAKNKYLLNLKHVESWVLLHKIIPVVSFQGKWVHVGLGGHFCLCVLHFWLVYLKVSPQQNTVSYTTTALALLNIKENHMFIWYFPGYIVLP